jgi:hypothetical protein
MDVQTRMALEERPHLPAPVDGAAIPEQLHGTAQVAEQVVQERADVEAGEIAGATPEIERQAPPSGRDHQPAADREAVATVAVAHTRGLAAGCPGPTNVRNEEEAAFIDEDEMGATSCGVFLSGAIPHASNGQWPPRPAPRPGVRASDSSTPGRSGPSTHDSGDTERRTRGESGWPPAPASTGRSCSRPEAGPSTTASRAAASGPPTTQAVAPASAWAVIPFARAVDTPATTGTRNSPRRGPGERRRTGSGRPLRAAPPVVVASPAARGHRVVSYHIACSRPSVILPLLMQDSILHETR